MKLISLSEKQFSTDLIFAQESDMSIEHQKAMSLGAFLAWANDYPVNALLKPQQTIDVDGLAGSWGITDSDSAEETLEWLLTEGHRVYWGDTLAVYRGQSGADEDSRALAFAQNLKEALPRILHYRLIASEADLFSQRVDAWDYGRVVFVASESHYLGYLTQEQAMSYILRALYQITKVYGTWIEYARSYLLGRLMWGGARSDSYDFVMVMVAMVEYQDSTWNLYPLDPFHKNRYEAEKQHLLAEPILPFKANKVAVGNGDEANAGVNHQNQYAGQFKPSLLHRVVSIPLLGHYIGFLIAVIVPFVLMLLLMPAIQAVFGESVTQGRRGSNIFGATFFSLVFLWTYFLSAKKNLRLTTPIIPIPLTWISGFFAVIGFISIFI
jgi:hypothetical protein